MHTRQVSWRRSISWRSSDGENCLFCECWLVLRLFWSRYLSNSAVIPLRILKAPWTATLSIKSAACHVPGGQEHLTKVSARCWIKDFKRTRWEAFILTGFQIVWMFQGHNFIVIVFLFFYFYFPDLAVVFFFRSIFIIEIMLSLLKGNSYQTFCE